MRRVSAPKLLTKQLFHGQYLAYRAAHLASMANTDADNAASNAMSATQTRGNG